MRERPPIPGTPIMEDLGSGTPDRPLTGDDFAASVGSTPASSAIPEPVDYTVLEQAYQSVVKGQYAPPEPLFSFLGGPAGTGKTFLARQRAELTSPPDAILCATTGIAAVNLGGVTINSTLRYFDTLDLQTNYELGRLNQTLRKLVTSGYRRLVIDEASMLAGKQLTILCTAIDEVNEWARDNGEPEFGITLVADFAQLGPIKEEFAFQSPCWDRFEEHTTLLTEPRRQADPDFVRALQQVRRGDREAISYFRQFIGRAEDRNFDGTTILAKNDEVDRYNKIRMLELKTPEEYYLSTRGGEHQPSEWKHIPDRLIVKKGCLVMVLANAYSGEGPRRELMYCNGDLGHFEGREIVTIHDPVSGEEDDVEVANVRLIRTGDVVQVTGVHRIKTTATGNKGEKAPRDEKEGWIKYMPLRCAYASTVHRSQGLSLDRVQVMINSHFWIMPGMTYVALSRARTPGGLRIVGTAEQFVARIRANGAVQRWL